MAIETSHSEKADLAKVESAPVDQTKSSTITNAMIATDKEHAMTLFQGLKAYPKACAWSILISTCIVMEGYDMTLIGSLYAMTDFQEKYGEKYEGGYQLTAAWQAGLSNSLQVGVIFGLLLAGQIGERIGYRKTMIGALAWTAASIFILFFAPNLIALLMGELLMGVPLGAFQSLANAYASEVCPVVLRPYLTTYINLCWLFGQVIASGILRGILGMSGQWAYRIPFAIQWVWPVPIAIGIYLAPESPWWLVRQGRKEDAIKSIMRLTSGDRSTNANAEETVAMMIHTNELEKAAQAGTSYLECFKGVNLRRTEVSCFACSSAMLCGSGIMGLSTYFFVQAGLAEDQSFNMSIAQYAIGICGTLTSWVLMAYFGRRKLFTNGMGVLAVIMFTMGGISFAGEKNASASWATGAMLLVFAFFYNSTVGPIAFAIVGEMASTRLRTKTIALARTLYTILNICAGVVNPYMLNPTAWNWRGKIGFLWGCFGLVMTIWCFFRLPEAKDRTYGELEVLFEQGISARKFAKTKVDAFEQTTADKTDEE